MTRHTTSRLTGYRGAWSLIKPHRSDYARTSHRIAVGGSACATALSAPLATARIVAAGGSVRRRVPTSRAAQVWRGRPVVDTSQASQPPPGRALDGSNSVTLDLPFVKTYAAGDEWAVLGDRTRRAIVERLADRPRSVGELADELPVSRPAVSQHLKVLKGAGLVTEQAAGTRRIYRLNPSAVEALRDQLDTFWKRALAGYADAVDQQTEERS